MFSCGAVKDFLPVFIVFASVLVGAATETGSPEAARRRFPALFEGKDVVEADSIKGSPGYVFRGEAEQCFKGDLAESDDELWREAEMDAKSNLYRFLTNGNPLLSVTMGGATLAYRYREGKRFHSIYFVAKAAVSVHEAGGQSSPVSLNKRDPVECSNRVAVCKARLAADRNDLHARCRLARELARSSMYADAACEYECIVNRIAADEHADRFAASELIFESVMFFERIGQTGLALKHCNVFLRCNYLRRWRQDEMAKKINAAKSRLLLR